MYERKDKGISNNLVKSESLSQRVVRGGVWVFALRITERGFGLIRLVILARILAPHDFGLMGIALLTMASLETFSQTGFQQALIQKKNNTEAYLDAAWTVLVLRGLLLFAILFFIAPYAAIFFKAPQAKTIIQVIGFSVLLQPFTNIGVIYFRKELQFNKQFLYQLSGTLADFIVAVAAVLVLRSVWALVFGLLAGNVARLIASYLIHPHRPHFSRDLGKAKELFRFGKWILGSSILIFLITQGDDIFVGKLLGATMLGFYQVAYIISNMPATEITHVISQVTFPAYSKLQDKLPSLRKAYLKTLQFTAFISIPLAGGIFILAPGFTRTFLGETWMSMVPAIQVLCVFGATRSIGATFGPLFQAVGRPRILTELAIIQLILLGILIYPFTLIWGIVGTSVAIVIPNLITQCIAAAKVARLIKCKSSDVSKPITHSLIVAAAIVLLIGLFMTFSSHNLVNFAISFMIGAGIYFCLIYVFDSLFDYRIKEFIIQKLVYQI